MNIKNDKITIVLDPKGRMIPLSTFKTAIDQLTIILHEVERSISDSKQLQLKWGINKLSLRSPATIGLINQERKKAALAEKTSRNVVSGINILMRERKRPEYFNNIALENARALAKLATDKLSRVAVYSDDKESEIKEQIIVNVTDILESFEYIGSIEGVLELISGREGQPIYFRVHDIVSQHNVKCLINDDILGQALQSFRKRVIVSGIIKSDNEDNPVSIKVDEIEILPDEKDLPEAQDVTKALKGSTIFIAPYD